MPMNATFKRVWLITGASRGIGARIAEAALATATRWWRRPATRPSVQKRFGTATRCWRWRWTSPTRRRPQAAVQAALARFGRIDVLVNNAGYGLLGAVEEATADEVRRLYDTNVFGLLNVTRAVLPPCASAAAAMSSTSRRWAATSRARLRRVLLDQVRRRGPDRGAACRTRAAGHPRDGGGAGLLPHRLPGRQQSLVTCRRASWTTTPPAPARCANCRQISLNQPGDPLRLAQAC
jgi:NAD(P)-dependent dehydrogenase (short-subunit alcohol dehydrogenase family)